jgi:hypothetical protein
LLNEDNILNVNATPFVSNEGGNSVFDFTLSNDSELYQDFDGFLPSSDKGHDLGHVDTSAFTSHTLCHCSLPYSCNTCTINSSNDSE